MWGEKCLPIPNIDKHRRRQGMRKDETYTEKLRADIALVQAELARFKLRGMGFTGEAKDRHDEHVAEMELKIDQLNSDLRNLDKVGEQQWKKLKDDLEKSWKELQFGLRNCLETFKTEPGVAKLHGGDDGPFPYGELSGRSTKKK